MAIIATELSVRTSYGLLILVVTGGPGDECPIIRQMRMFDGYE